MSTSDRWTLHRYMQRSTFLELASIDLAAYVLLPQPADIEKIMKQINYLGSNWPLKGPYIYIYVCILKRHRRMNLAKAITQGSNK